MPKKIEDLKGLDRAGLDAALTEAIASQKELAALADDELTDEKLTELESVIEFVTAARGEVAERDAADQARADRIAAARAAADEPEAEAEPVAEPEAEQPEEEVEVVVPDDASEIIEEELVTASGKSVVARAAAKAPAVHMPEPEPEEGARATILAAANVPDFTSGQELVDFEDVARAFAARTRSFSKPSAARKPVSKTAKGQKVMGTDGNVYSISDQASQYGVVRIQKPENEFSTGLDDSVADQLDVLNAASKESRLSGGSLVAAGGWCAPSETLYGPFCAWETVSGILSIPEVSIRRGGINFTKGPDDGTLAATWGFLQTEAQAEAGTEKVCYEIECPPFSEVRLDAIGFCVTNGILTNVGYPELTRRVLEIGATAHAHKVNAQVISRISTAIGTAIDYSEVGSVSADILDGISLQATRLRYVYALAPTQTLEVVVPVWAKEIFRSDLSRRTGVDLLAVTDAQINSYFSVRNLAIQFVYDYQPLAAANTGTWTSWPDTLEILIYPAGAFVKGTADVISLDTIYDSVGLSTNTYTAAFFEEGLLVANMCGSGVKVSIDTACLAGVTGAAELTCIEPTP
jgi:hypothetical protein